MQFSLYNIKYSQYITTFVAIFRRFPTTFRRFPKIVQNLSEVQTNVSTHFPKISEHFSTAGAGRPSHSALRMNYIVNCRLSGDLLVVSGVHGVHLGESTISRKVVGKI